MGDRVADVAGYLAGAVAVLGTLWKVLIDRGRRSDPVLRYAYACGVMLGAAMTVTAPATASAVTGTVPDLSWLTLIGDQLKTGAVGALAMLACATRSAAAARRAVRRQVLITGATMLVSIVAFTAAGTTRAGDDLGASGPGRLVLVGYIALFTVHCAWCLSVFGLVMARCARHLPRGSLRLGLQLMVGAALAGLLWTADNLNDMADVLTTGHENGAETVQSAVAAAVCLTLGFAGATATAWAGHLGTWAGRVRAWHYHRRLAPLWRAMRAVLPEIEFAVAAGEADRGGRLSLRGAQFALYRRVIEIRDGQLALRPYLHPRIPHWVTEFTGANDTGAPQRAAVVEAATIAAALEAARAGHRFSTGEDVGWVPYPVSADIGREAAWLIRVAGAFTGSAVVARTRDRVREELRCAPEAAAP
ncbi:MAB_1171c family putative transporter [Kitasatospora sp. LaBMicrA B282]|uniref:MAB_1171c family putative transporter n=1 Tax=Kitasatospora sp. LaBMicrA B282 TaxID=3420949 RepID=UPI003D0AB47A